MAKNTEIGAKGEFSTVAKIANESGKSAGEGEVKDIGMDWSKPPCSYVEGNGAKGDTGHK